MAESLRCDQCGKQFRTERGLSGHVERQHPVEAVGNVAEETEKAIAEAKVHLQALDLGAVAVLRRLARQIDGQDQQRPDGSMPPVDNTLMPTYLRYAESLGLTPVGRLKVGMKKETPKGKLGHLRSITGGKAS